AKFRDEIAVVKQSKYNDNKRLREEFEIYFSLQNHDNILKLYGVVAENYHLVLEYAPNGDLSQYLKRNIVDWRSKAKICHGIARGVMHCHRNNVYHLDLKPQNILLDKDFTPKLADFGLSSSKSRLELNGGKAGGTIIWVAPERVSSDAKMLEFFEKYPKLSDMYSFGLILWSVAMNGETPYKELSIDKIKKQKRDRNTIKRLLKSLPKESPHRYTQLISDLTKYDPEERCQLPSALLELEHVYKYYNKKAIVNAKNDGPSFGVTDLVLKWNHDLSLKDDDNYNCYCVNFSYEKPIRTAKEFSIYDYE
ncbi:6525_t:CDS:2, partial [Dentiscutata heterogama]